MSLSITIKAFALGGVTFDGGSVVLPARATTHVGVAKATGLLTLLDNSSTPPNTALWVCTAITNERDVVRLIEHDPVLQAEIDTLAMESVGEHVAATDPHPGQYIRASQEGVTLAVSDTDKEVSLSTSSGEALLAFSGAGLTVQATDTLTLSGGVSDLVISDLGAVLDGAALTTTADLANASDVLEAALAVTHGSVDAISTAATTACPTTPTVVLLPTKQQERAPLLWDISTGALTMQKAGNYTLNLTLNIVATATRNVYLIAQYWNGSAWVYDRYTARKAVVMNGVDQQVKFSSTRYIPAGQMRRYLVWASGACNLVTEDLPGLGTGVGTVPAIRMQVTMDSQG